MDNRSFVTAGGRLTADVAPAGTFTVNYPSGIEGGQLGGDGQHVLNIQGAQLEAAKGHFSVSFGATAATITLGSGRTTLKAGAEFTVQFQRQDLLGDARGALVPNSVLPVSLVKVQFGAVDTADADGVCESQSVSAGVAAVLDGAISDVSSGAKAVFDVPRNVVAAWTNTAVLTFTGKDEFGNTVVESSASGTSHTGKKAFKEITSVTTSANITGATVGTGVILGLPFFLGDKADIVAIASDGTAESVSASVAGDLTTATATTGDVRGTVTFTTAPNSAKKLTALVAGDPGNRGRAHFAG